MILLQNLAIQQSAADLDILAFFGEFDQGLGHFHGISLAPDKRHLSGYFLRQPALIQIFKSDLGDGIFGNINIRPGRFQALAKIIDLQTIDKTLGVTDGSVAMFLDEIEALKIAFEEIN